MGGPGAIPDYVRGAVVVPACRFGDYLSAGGGGGEVGADVTEALRRRIFGCCLSGGLVRVELVGSGKACTEISCMAASRVLAVRATMTTLAPFCASRIATLLPMPCEPPVTTTVFSWCEYQPAVSNRYWGGDHTRPSTGNWFLLLKRPIISAARTAMKTQRRAPVQYQPNAIDNVQTMSSLQSK